MIMDYLFGGSSKHDIEYSNSTPNSTTLLSSVPGREHSLDEEKLSRVLIERVLPPFSKSLRLQALVVYQADREKMNCLLVNRNYEKLSSQPDPSDLDSRVEHVNGLDETSDLSDSGYLESTKLLVSDPRTPEKSLTTNGVVGLCESTESISCNHTISRRKRKLCRPCKIPQNGSVTPEPSDTSAVEESKVARITSSITSTSDNSIVNPVLTSPTATSSKNISDSVLLPVTAVTLLPRVSVFSLPVTVLSTVPRPILPRISQEKPVITMTTIPATPLVPTSAALSQSTSLSRVTESTSSPAKLEMSKSSGPLPTVASDPSNRRFGKSFLCNQCRCDFSSLSLLCAHTFSVHRCFRCTICDAQFTQRSNLQRHSLRHVGFKPFICKVCDKAYYRKDHLVRHIELSHPGRDPRLSLTVKLSSAECLDYLERLQTEGSDVDQAQLLCQTPDDSGPGTHSPLSGSGSMERTEPLLHNSLENSTKEMSAQ